MAGPIEILIVVGVFGIIGVYLYIVHRFIKAGEASSARQKPEKAASERNPSDSKLTAAVL